MAQPEPPRFRVDLVWEGGKRFRGGPPGGPTLLLDGDSQEAPGPVQGMMAALAACSAIDVVEILNKRRTPPAEVRVEVEYSRAASIPRRLTAAHLRYRVATASERHHVERAVALSFETYCSISRSLDPAIELSFEVEMLPQSGEARSP